MPTDLLTYLAIAVGLMSLAFNFLAWRKKPRRQWLYLIGILASMWFTASYVALALGIVSVEFMTASGILRWGAIMGMALAAFHAWVDS